MSIGFDDGVSSENNVGTTNLLKTIAFNSEADNYSARQPDYKF